MPLNGEYGAWSGPLKPSSEWRFHLDIMRARPDVGAIVHCHPPYCTALAMLHRADPRRPLHDRAVRRPGHRMHEIRALRHQGIVGSGDRRPRRPPWRAARQSRRDRHRRQPRKRDAPGGGAGGAGAHVLSRDRHRPAAILSDEEIARIVERFRPMAAGSTRKRRRRPKARARKTKAAATKRGAKKKATRKKAGAAVARK